MILTSVSISLVFVESIEYICSILGQPNRIYTKGDDKLQIHSKSALRAAVADYFYNYFDVGIGNFVIYILFRKTSSSTIITIIIIDILFDSQRHTIKKVVLHTNTPHHHEFNRYAKVCVCG
jgi:hypothetical protein